MDPSGYLSRFRLFAGLSPDEGAGVIGRVRMAKHKAGEFILHRSDSTSDLYLLISGSVSIKSYSDEGQEVAYLQIDAPSIFGEFAAIDGLTRSADVLALTDIEVGRMSSAGFRKSLLECPQLALNLAVHLVGKIRGLSERIFEFGAFAVPIRIRRALLRLAKEGRKTPGGIEIRPAPTHYELAIMLSTHREAVSRELGNLSRKGVLKTGRQTISILSLAALEKLTLEDGE